MAATVGCHPTHCLEIEDPAVYFEHMSALIEKHRNRIVAVGECGLGNLFLSMSMQFH